MAIRHTSSGWLVDVQPGGRGSRRVRRIFLTKENARLFERQAFIDQEKTGLSLASSLTIIELIDRFTQDYARVRLRGFADEKYRLKVIRDFFSIPNKAAAEIQMNDGDRFVAFRQAAGKKTSTINRDINSLKRIFSWGVEQRYIPYNPLAGLKHLRGAKSRVRWLTQEETDRLLSKCQEIDNGLYGIIFTALETGFRLGNMEILTSGDIRDGFVYAKRTKSGMPYEVPVSEALEVYIKSLTINDRLFDFTNFRRRFNSLVKASGFSVDPDDPMKVTFHTLRHTFASKWLQRGVPIYTVSKWLGHSSVKMTESVYGHLSQNHHIETMRRYEAESRRHFVDSQVIPFPENASVSTGPNGIRTRDLCLEREDKC